MKNYYFAGCLLLAAAAVQSAQAEVTYTCTAGKNFGQNEGIDKMFDNNTGTKYCGGAGDDCWALVTASEPVYVRAYETTLPTTIKNPAAVVHVIGRCTALTMKR